MSNPPDKSNGFLRVHAARLSESFERLLGRPLLTIDSNTPVAEALYHAPFVLLSSDTAADPLFNYGNRTALELFELDWESLIAMRARNSAEPDHQETRAQLMQRVRSHGYIEDYSGIRISASGKRFMIQNAIVWNIGDADGALYGQAATFNEWRFL